MEARVEEEKKKRRRYKKASNKKNKENAAKIIKQSRWTRVVSREKSRETT